MASIIIDLPFTPSTGHAFILKSVYASGVAPAMPAKGISTIPINTVQGDSQFVSLVNSRFTIQPGSYLVTGLAELNGTGVTYTAIRKVTTNSMVLLSESNVPDLGSENIPLSIEGILEVSAETTYEFVRSTSFQGTQPSTSFGVEEVYASLTFVRL